MLKKLSWNTKNISALFILLIFFFLASTKINGNLDIYAQSTSNSSLIDSRISTAHLSGKYPDLGAEYLIEGAKDAHDLGFQSIEIFLHPAICWADESKQKGIYQTTDWCRSTNPYGPQTPTLANSLTELATHLRYKQLFKLPFKTFLITAETTKKKNDSNYFLQIAFSEFTTEELDALYKDFYDLTLYLLNNYKNSNKTFIIQTPNEMDWSMIGDFKIEKSPTQLAIKNATSYWNKIQQAVDDAKQLVPEEGVKIYHGCEINHVKKAMNGGITAANNVLPNTHCDLYGYSAYDIVLTDIRNSADPTTITSALNYIASKAPDSRDFGNKNIYISEIGIAERPYPNVDTASLLSNFISQSLLWGAPLVNTWALYDNECTTYLPTTNDTCPGYWMRKPDGTLSHTYEIIKSVFSVTPTPTTRQSSCDPTGDGSVDLLDFQLWKDEFLLVKRSTHTDCFHRDGKVDLLDFQAWKDISFNKITDPS